jgi:hypothetical protein
MSTSPRIPAIWLLTADIMSQLGGGFRQQRWCEYILAHGESVRLFHVAGAFGVRWVDVHSIDELRALRSEWIAAAPPRSGVRDSRTARIARLLKHVFLLDLFFPSNFRLVATMNAMLRDAPSRVALLCSSPPFSMGVAGRMMKALHGRRIIMALDMRDLWSLHTAFAGPKFQKRFIERWVISGADIFTTVAPALAARFKNRFGRNPTVVFNIATHALETTADPVSFDWRLVSGRIRPDTKKLVYTGSIPAGFYDLDAFVNAVEAFARDSASQRMQFVFIGAGGELATRLRGRSIPEDLVLFVPQMNHAAVAEVQNAADILIFLGYRADDNQGQVSIKLFEYFRRKKPILPIHVRRHSDVDWLINYYCDVPCPELIDQRVLVDSLVELAKATSISLPRARDVESKERMLLTAYDDVARVIVASVRASA